MEQPNLLKDSLYLMSKQPTESKASLHESFSIDHVIDVNPQITRRTMLGLTGMAGVAALTGLGTNTLAQTGHRRPRIACLVSYWGAPRSHADWIITKLLDGYWWEGAHTPSRVDVVAIYIHQFEESGLGQKVAASKNIPVFKTVAEAITLGGKELAVDGVVIVAEHGEYPTNLKGQWMLPRWWIYQQVISVFERSRRSVPVFNDKHLSYSWDEAKWMFDKSRELNFPLTGGSSIPIYYRTPEIELDTDTPIKNSIVVGDTADEGALFHIIDLLQSFVERRKGGETGVRSVQCIHGPDTWQWTDRHPWASSLLESVRKKFKLKPGHFQENSAPNVTVIEYNDGTQAAVFSGKGVGWTYAAEIQGRKEPTLISILGWPGPFAQYHASNAQPHWITEMMLTKKEPFNAERLLLSTGIVSYNMESNWENGKYSAIGRRIETPFLNMTYRPTHGAQFSKGQRPPSTPYIRGFEK
jgi:hypothetical protein